MRIGVSAEGPKESQVVYRYRKRVVTYQSTLYKAATKALGSLVVPSHILSKLCGCRFKGIEPIETKTPDKITKRRIPILTIARTF